MRSSSQMSERMKATAAAAPLKIAFARVVGGSGHANGLNYEFTWKSAWIRNLNVEARVIRQAKECCTHSSYFILKPFFRPVLFSSLFLFFPSLPVVFSTFRWWLCVSTLVSFNISYVLIVFASIVLYSRISFLMPCSRSSLFYSLSVFFSSSVGHFLLTYCFCLRDEYTSP